VLVRQRERVQQAVCRRSQNVVAALLVPDYMVMSRSQSLALLPRELHHRRLST